jgi:hypothetical protein
MNSSNSSIRSGGSGTGGVKLQPKPVAMIPNPNIKGMGKPDLANSNPLASLQGSYKN